MSSNLRKWITLSATALTLVGIGAESNSFNANASHKNRIHRMVKRHARRSNHHINKRRVAHKRRKRTRHTYKKLGNNYCYVANTGWQPGPSVVNSSDIKYAKPNTIVRIIKSKPITFDGAKFTYIQDKKFKGYIMTKVLSNRYNAKVHVKGTDVLIPSSLSDKLSNEADNKQHNTENKDSSKYRNTRAYKIGLVDGTRDEAMTNNSLHYGDDFNPYITMKGEKQTIKDLTSNRNYANKAFRYGYLDGLPKGDYHLHYTDYTPHTPYDLVGKDDADDYINEDRDNGKGLFVFAKKYANAKGQKAKRKVFENELNNNNDSFFKFDSLRDAKIELLYNADYAESPNDLEKYSNRKLNSLVYEEMHRNTHDVF